MSHDLEHTIRERAYQLWIESGCHDGHADSHWLAAQREIVSASLGGIAKAIGSEKAIAKPAKAKALVKASRKKKAA